MTLASLKERLGQALQQTLKDRASSLLVERLLRRIEQAGDPAGLRRAVADIRTAVRMFVGEEVGEQVARRMFDILGGSDRPAGSEPIGGGSRP